MVMKVKKKKGTVYGMNNASQDESSILTQEY